MQQRYTHVGRRVWDKEKRKYVKTCTTIAEAQRVARDMNGEDPFADAIVIRDADDGVDLA